MLRPVPVGDVQLIHDQVLIREWTSRVMEFAQSSFFRHGLVYTSIDDAKHSVGVSGTEVGSSPRHFGTALHRALPSPSVAYTIHGAGLGRFRAASHLTAFPSSMSGAEA